MRAYLNLFDFKQKVDYKVEILAGLTVALALIPEAIAFFINSRIIAAYRPICCIYNGINNSNFWGQAGNDFGSYWHV